MEARERDKTLDIVKGIGILAVIVGHLTAFGRQFIFSFHMPLFFVIAGFLYHRKPFAIQMKSDFKRLIIPYLITAGIIVICYGLIELSTRKGNTLTWLYAALWGSGSALHESPLFGDFPHIGAIWFLLAMFWCKFSFTLIESTLRNQYLLLSTSVIISVSACLVDKYIINLPFAILPGLGAVVFYAAGFFLRKLYGKYRVTLMGGGILLIMWALSTFVPDRPLGLVTCDYPVWPLSVIGGIAATIVIYTMCKKIAHVQIFPIQFITWCGEVSILFLCFHLIDLDMPIRRHMGINGAITAIVFDLTFCIFGTVLLSQFSVTRKIFHINKVSIPFIRR